MKHPVMMIQSRRSMTPPLKIEMLRCDCLIARLRPAKRKPPKGDTKAMKTVITNRWSYSSLATKLIGSMPNAFVQLSVYNVFSTIGPDAWVCAVLSKGTNESLIGTCMNQGISTKYVTVYERKKLV